MAPSKSAGLALTEESLSARLATFKELGKPVLLVLTHADFLYADSGKAENGALSSQADAILSKMLEVQQLKVVITMIHQKSVCRAMPGKKASSTRLAIPTST